MPPRPAAPRSSLPRRLAAVVLALTCTLAGCRDRTPAGGSTTTTAGLTLAAEDSIAGLNANQWSRPFDSVSVRPTSIVPGCDSTPPGRHWYRQTATLERDSGQVVESARASLVAYRNLKFLSDRRFANREVRLGRLHLDAAFSGLPAGEYCLSTAFAGTTAQINDAARWRIFVYDVTTPNQPPVRQMPFLYRIPDSATENNNGGDDDPDAPTPALRFESLTSAELDALRRGVMPLQRRDGGRGPGAPSGSAGAAGGAAASIVLALAGRTHAGSTTAGLAAVGANAAVAVQKQDGWYRCGAGCCGGSFGFQPAQ